jgi:quercetin dioxygenase-like cupin family protein
VLVSQGIEHNRAVKFIVGSAAGEHIVWPHNGHEFWIKASGEQTGGSFSLTEVTMPAGTGAGLHVQDSAEESFWILAGEYRFTVGEEQFVATSGDLVVVPRGVPHACTVGDSGGRHLTLFAPAGCERVFREIGKAMAENTLTAEFFSRLGADTNVRFLAQ